MTHPHKDLIIALLDDPTLEVEWFERFEGKWLLLNWNFQTLVSYITGHQDYQFRLREKPKPDVVVIYPVHMEDLSVKFYPKNRVNNNNLRLTFTADGILKNAEMI